MSIHWIKTELARLFPNTNLEYGLDLNGDGRIQESEKPDINDDGHVEDNEWGKFWQNNCQQLAGFFKHYSKQNYFKPDNPIHDLLYIESEVVSDDDIQNAYEVLTSIVNNARDRISNSGEFLTIEEKVNMIVDIIEEKFMTGPMCNDTFFEPLSCLLGDNNSLLDADALCLIVLTVAHELDIPLNAAGISHYMFLRFKNNNGDEVNWSPLDRQMFSDVDYAKRHGEFLGSFGEKISFATYDDNKLLAYFFDKRARSKLRGVEAGAEFGSYYRSSALQDYEEAMEFDNNSFLIHFDYARQQGHLSNVDEAQIHYQKAIDLAYESGICYAQAYFNMAAVEAQLGDDITYRIWNRTKKHNPKLGFYIPSIMNYLMVNYGDGIKAKEHYDTSIKYYMKAFECNRHLLVAYYGLGDVYRNIAEFTDNKNYYDFAINVYSTFIDNAFALVSDESELAESYKPILAMAYVRRAIATCRSDSECKDTDPLIFNDIESAGQLDPSGGALIVRYYTYHARGKVPPQPSLLFITTFLNLDPI